MPRRTQAQIIFEEAQNFLSASGSTRNDRSTAARAARRERRQAEGLANYGACIDQESVGTTRPVKTTGICNGTFEAKQGKQI